MSKDNKLRRKKKEGKKRRKKIKMKFLGLQGQQIKEYYNIQELHKKDKLKRRGKQLNIDQYENI